MFKIKFKRAMTNDEIRRLEGWMARAGLQVIAMGIAADNSIQLAVINRRQLYH